MWVAYSERPLRPDELCQALGVEVGSKDLNGEDIPMIGTIMSCALGLVTVDSSSSTVRFVHFTLQEYILATPALFQSPHSMIAEVCLTYLDFECIRNLSPTLSSPPPTAPFLDYASCHWGAHARREISKSAIPLVLKLLDRFDAHIACKLLLLNEPREWQPFGTRGYPMGFTGLHGGVILGVLELLVSLFDIKKWDINATDLRGRTALAWAVRKGFDKDVKILLEQEGIGPDISDNGGRSPFSWALECGHSETVRMLLDRNYVNPNNTDKSGRTLFSWAIDRGSEKTMEMLIQWRNFNPDAANDSGLTALSLAVMYGEERIVQMLLRRSDVNPNLTDESGQTPLSWAARYESVEIVELLLERRDLIPDIADESGRTPLSWAAGNSRPEIVESLLMRNDVNPDAVDEDGRRPLSWAVVGLVDETYINLDKEGRNYLDNQFDSGFECAMVAWMLLERNDVNPDAVDKSGRTPLSWAASYGRKGIVRALLERSDVTPDTPDERGRTPLLWAVMYGHAEVVKMLLERNNINPDAADGDGRTPLSWAAESGYEGIAEMLLHRGDVNPGAADTSGRTPLSWAVTYKQKGIVDMLLGLKGVNLDAADGGSQELLLLSDMFGHLEVVDMLERNDVNPDSIDENCRTIFPQAAGNGYGRVVRLLEGPQGPIGKSLLNGELSGPFRAGTPLLLEPPLKRIRRI